MKTNKELIEDYKKSNKQRREKIAQKAGFKTGAEYLNSIEKPAKIEKPVKKEQDMLDYVIAFDTTGSMAAYINQVKKHVEQLIPQMFSQDIDLRMKIVAFGDYCDMKSKNVFGNAYQESPFTNVQQSLIDFVQNAKNTSGGDSDEFYELVIKKITEETPWRKNAKKAVLFIADCEPHDIGYTYSDRIIDNHIDWKKEAKKAAALGISFDTLTIIPDYAYWYQELSKITGGVSLPFKSSHKINEVVTASAYVRGGEKSRATFTASYASAVSSGDTELIGTYKTLSKLMED